VPLEHFTRLLDFAVCHRERLVFFQHVDAPSCERRGSTLDGRVR
jgi:hypothetical protein